MHTLKLDHHQLNIKHSGIWKMSTRLIISTPTISMQGTEAAIHRCFSKQLFLKISQFSQKNTCFSVSFIKLSASKAVLNFIKKETLALVFSCEFCEISKNTFFYRTLLVAASESFWIPTQSALRLCSFPFQITLIHTLKLDHHQPEHQAY